VVNYDRRDHSGDTIPYAVEREIGDLDAFFAEVGACGQRVYKPSHK